MSLFLMLQVFVYRAKPDACEFYDIERRNLVPGSGPCNCSHLPAILWVESCLEFCQLEP